MEFNLPHGSEVIEMAKRMDNENSSVKPAPGEMQREANKPASAPTYVPPATR